MTANSATVCIAPAPRGNARWRWSSRGLGRWLAAGAALCLAYGGPLTRRAAADDPALHVGALYHLDEGGQTLDDSSGHGNTGTLGPSVAIEVVDPVSVGGKFDKALSFDGVDDFARVPGSPTLEPAHPTVELWVRSTAPGPNAYLIAKGAQTCSAPSYSFNVASGPGDLFFDLWNGTTLVRSTPPIPKADVFDGAWHHVAGTFDGTTVRLYLDGTERGSGTPVPGGFAINYALPTTTDLTLGTYNGTCFLPFKGSLDEVRIWNEALSPSEIRASAQAGLRALWHLNGTAADSSGYANNGTLMNGPMFSTGQNTNFRQAVSLDGMNDFISVPNDSTLSPPDALSVDAWIFVAANTFFPSIVSKGNVGNFAESYALFLFTDGSTNGQVAFLINTDGTSGGRAIAFGGATIALNTWTHVAGTYDGMTVRAFLNGTPVPSTPHSGSINSTSNAVLLGKSDRTPSAFPDSFFNGRIDEAHLWGRALSANEVRFLAGNGGTSGDTDTRAELLLPGELEEEFEGAGNGAIYGEDFDAKSVAAAGVLKTMLLDFIVPDTQGHAVRPPPGCAVNPVNENPKTPDSTGASLQGCQIGLGGLSTLVTATRILVAQKPPKLPVLSKRLRFDMLLEAPDAQKLNVRVKWN